MTRRPAAARLARALLALGLVAGLGGVLLIAALHLYLPRAEGLRGPVAGWIEAAVGYRVQAGDIALVGHGLGARLVVSDLALLDPASGATRLRAARLQLDLDGPASLLARAPRLDGGAIDGAQVTVRREADGRLVIPGLDRLAIDDGKLQAYFLKHGDLRVDGARLHWHGAPGAAPRPLGDLTLTLENRGRRHRLTLDAVPAGAPGLAGRLVLRADLRGAAASPGDWRGRLALEASDLALRDLADGPIPRERLPAGLADARGRLDLRGTGTWDAGTLASIEARFDLRKLTTDAAATPIERLSGALRWRAEATGWQARLSDIGLAQGAQRCSGDGIDLRLTRGARGRLLEAQVAHLDLALLDRLLRLAPPEAGIAADLARARIAGRGEALALALTLPEAPNTAADWRLRGRLIDLTTAPSGAIPGVAGLDAFVDGGPAAGHGLLAANDLTLDMPDLFRAPLAASRLAGTIRWGRDAQGQMVIEAPRLLAENADIATLSQLTLRLPTAGGPEIALRTHFRNAEVAAIPRYLPVGIMNPRLVRWLDRALPRGRVPAGDLLVLGPLAAFPFGQGEGRFEVLFDVEDVELSYNQDWPSIVQADGRLRFLNRRLDIELSDARTLDTALGPVHAAIPDLIDAERVLIRGAGRGPFADGLRLIEASPLAERLGTLGEAFAATGPMHLDLDLAYPLDDEAPIALRGEVTWPTPDAGLAVVGTDIALAGLGGQLVVTADGVATERLTGQIWDQPVTLRIHPTGPDEEATRVEVEGTTPIAELARRLPSGPWSLAAGRLPWHLDLTFEHQDLEAHSPPLDWELTSDLAGVRLDLPAPFGKDAATIRRLRLTGKSAPSDARLTIDATLGALAARLDLAEGDGARLTRGSVGVGRPAPALPDGPGLVVAGQLDALDVPAWLAWAQRHDLATGPGGPLPLRRLDLRIARLDLGPATSHDLELHAERHPGRWQARIDTAELAGALTLPDQTRATPMEIRLEHLDLAELLVRQDDAEPPRPRPPGRARLSDPRTARPFTLEVARLLWRGESLGQAEVRSFTVPSGLVFDRLSIGGPPATLFGSGEWVVGDDGLPRTELTLRGSGADLGRILHTVGYGSVLDAAPTTAHLDLGWPGGPDDIRVATMAGRLSVEIGAGRLLAVEPGLGRVLGILNLGALQRRLALDFSDLYGKGFSFERIDGELAIGSGSARIDRFRITGPSGDIDIAGRADLIDGQLEQVVTVTPEIGSGVALASAVAGGPLVGAAVYVADQVAGDVVDRLIRYRYRVTGPWADPTMTRSDRLGSLLSGLAGGGTEVRAGETAASADAAPPSEPPNLFLDPP